MIAIFMLTAGIMVSGCSSEKPSKTEKKIIRGPVVAEMWYPADSAQLKNMLQEFFDNAKSQPVEGEIRGIISPHASYTYSGQTAAYGFKQLEGRRFETVVVVGPKHPPKSNNTPPVNFGGVCVDNSNAYRTPLGVLDIDTAFINTLLACNKIIQRVPEAFVDEHSVESEIPFLQMALGNNFKIVPLIMTEHSFETCKALADAIVKAGKGKNMLIVASSDFYHGYDYEACKASVAEACSLILKYDINGFYSAFRDKEIACGGAPITVCMLACKTLGANNITKLYTTNSGDVTGEKRGWIVGYNSFVFTGSESGGSSSGKTEFQKLDEKAQKELLKMARKTIETYAKKRESLKFEPTIPVLNEKRGVFVTLLTKGGELRGCIGHHEGDIPLYELVPQMAIASAFQDYRFPPVSSNELDNIKIKISVYLTNVYEIKDTSEYQLGVHGIIMEKSGRASTFLPEVPIEQNWTKEVTLNYLAQKAGLPQDAWKEGATFYVYKTQEFGE